MPAGRVIVSFREKEKNYKSNSLIQTLEYRSNICYSKIHHKGTWKSNSLTPYLIMWQCIIYKKSASGSRTLPCLVIFFQSLILIRKYRKCSLNKGTLVPASAIYQRKYPFTVFNALFLFFRIISYDSGLFSVLTKYFRHRYSIKLFRT